MVNQINHLCDTHRTTGGDLTQSGLHRESIMRNMYQVEG